MVLVTVVLLMVVQAVVAADPLLVLLTQVAVEELIEQGLEPAPDGNGTQPIMMMTSDISLTRDPTGEYQKIVRDFADNATAFDDAFKQLAI